MNGLESYSLVYGELQSAVLARSSALDGETQNKACTKNPPWYCGCNSVSLGLTWRESHWRIQESWPNAEKLSPLKSCCLLLQLTCIFSQVVGVFHVVCCDDKKKKMQFWICHERHVFVATHIRLYSCYWVSHSLHNWLSILAQSYMAKIHKKPRWMHQLYIYKYIYIQISGIYLSSLRITVPWKVPIAKM